MFGKKKATDNKDKANTDLKIKIDNVEMESVSEQLREIEAKKVRDKKS